MSPFVERVTNSFPHVQRTVASTYSGWISVFMAPLILGARHGEDVAVLVDLVDGVLGVHLGGDLVARRARGRAPEDGAVRRAGGQPGNRHAAQRLAVAGERDGERTRVPAPAV